MLDGPDSLRSPRLTVSTIRDLLRSPGSRADNYFDVYVEPTYIAMWKGDVIHCALLLGVLSGVVLVERWLAHHEHHRSHADRAAVGALAGLLFILASAGSSITDKYMPRDERSEAQLAWRAHAARVNPGGRCSRYMEQSKRR